MEKVTWEIRPSFLKELANGYERDLKELQEYLKSNPTKDISEDYFCNIPLSNELTLSLRWKPQIKDGEIINF